MEQPPSNGMSTESTESNGKGSPSRNETLQEEHRISTKEPRPTTTHDTEDYNSEPHTSSKSRPTSEFDGGITDGLNTADELLERKEENIVLKRAEVFEEKKPNVATPLVGEESQALEGTQDDAERQVLKLKVYELHERKEEDIVVKRPEVLKLATKQDDLSSEIKNVESLEEAVCDTLDETEDATGEILDQRTDETALLVDVLEEGRAPPEAPLEQRQVLSEQVTTLSEISLLESELQINNEGTTTTDDITAQEDLNQTTHLEGEDETDNIEVNFEIADRNEYALKNEDERSILSDEIHKEETDMKEATENSTAHTIEAASESIVETIDDSTVETASESIVQTTDDSAVETVTTSIFETVDDAAVGAVSESIVQTVDDSAAVSESVVETVEYSAAVSESIVGTVDDSTIEAASESICQTTDDSGVETVATSIFETVDYSTVEAVSESIVQTTDDSAVETVTTSIFETVDYSTVEAVSESIAGTMDDSAAVTESVVKTVDDQTVEDVKMQRERVHTTETTMEMADDFAVNDGTEEKIEKDVQEHERRTAEETDEPAETTEHMEEETNREEWHAENQADKETIDAKDMHPDQRDTDESATKLQHEDKTEETETSKAVEELKTAMKKQEHFEPDLKKESERSRNDRLRILRLGLLGLALAGLFTTWSLGIFPFQIYEQPLYERFKLKIRNIAGDKFPGQDAYLWNCLLSASKPLLGEKEVPRPGVAVLAYTGSDVTARCMTSAFLKEFNEITESESKRILIINKNLITNSKQELDNKLYSAFQNDARVAIFPNLEKFDAGTLLLMHDYCDDQFAPFKDVLLIFLVEVPRENLSPREIEEFLLKTFEEKVGKDEAVALVSRIVRNVGEVVQEKQHIPDKIDCEF